MAGIGAGARRKTVVSGPSTRRIIRGMSVPNRDRAESPASHAAMQRHGDADLALLLAARSRHQQRRALMLTPEERMVAMQKLIDQSWAVLQANPAALAHFRARNFRKRATAVGESAHGT